jgi:peroxiredoxin
MKLKVGDVAPSFTVESVNSGTISLEDYRGKKVLLAFGRYFGCPVCQIEFKELQDILKENALDVQVIYIVQSAPDVAKAFADEKGADFPIIPVKKDGGKFPIYADYGVGKLSLVTLPKLAKRAKEAYAQGIVHGPKEGSETQSPAEFVIDVNGKITYANIGIMDSAKLLSALK